MMILFKASHVAINDEERDVSVMNQYEFAEFLAKRKRQEQGIQNITSKIKYMISHPILHNLCFKLLLFVWIFIYLSFPSWFLTVWILYSILELNHKRFIVNFNKIYFPLICLCVFMMYVSNIYGVMVADCFETNMCKYGFYTFDIPFFHLLMQISILTYSLCSKRIYIKYKEDQTKEKEIQEKIKIRMLSKKYEKRRQNMMKNNTFKRDRLMSFEAEVHSAINKPVKKSTSEMLVGFVVSNWDIGIMTALYFAGAYQIDIYHISLMVFFVMFLLYPSFCRRNYIILILFIHFIVTIKYMYTLTEDLLGTATKEYLQVIGFSTKVRYENKFFRADLINNNWLIVLLSYIQYRTYKSTYYQQNLTPVKLKADRKDFIKRHPDWSKFLNLCKDIAYISVPWISFIIYIANAFLNGKTFMNLVIYAYSLFLISIYVLSNKDTSKSLYRLIISWNIGIGITVVIFLLILVYQILCLGPIVRSRAIVALLKVMPEILKKNGDLIGFNNYSKETQLQLSIILFAYVLNFVVAIITKRHLVNLYRLLKHLEVKNDSRPTLNRVNTYKHVQWLFQLKFLWPVFDIIAKCMFTVLGLTIIVFSIHWKLSAFNWIYLIILCTYSVCVSFSLVFKEKQEVNNGDYQRIDDDNVGIDEMLALSKSKDAIATARVLALRKLFATIIMIVSSACLLMTYMSTPIDQMRDRYPESNNLWEMLIYITFFFGVNATTNAYGYSFFYQCSGYLTILLITILERKAELWMYDKLQLMDFTESSPKPTSARDYYFAETIKEESSKREDSSEEKEGYSSRLSINFENNPKSITSEQTPFDDAIDLIHTHKFAQEKSLKISPSAAGKSPDIDPAKGFDNIISPIKVKSSSAVRASMMTQNIADDPLFQKQVHNMLKLKYKYGFMKGAGVTLLTLIILMIL